MTGTRLDEWVQQTALADLLTTERRMELWIRPRPRWLPAPVWWWLLRRLLYRTERLEANP